MRETYHEQCKNSLSRDGIGFLFLHQALFLCKILIFWFIVEFWSFFH